MKQEFSEEFKQALSRTSGPAFACTFPTGECSIVLTYPYIAVQGSNEEEATEILEEVLIDWFIDRDSADEADKRAYDNLRMPFFERLKLRFLVWRSSVRAQCRQENGGPSEGYTTCRIAHAS